MENLVYRQVENNPNAQRNSLFLNEKLTNDCHSKSEINNPSDKIFDNKSDQKCKKGELKRGNSKKKNDDSPRLPPNGYVRYLNANRNRVKNENPDLQLADIVRKLAAEWSSLDPSEKKIYQDEAKKAKIEFWKKQNKNNSTPNVCQKETKSKSPRKSQNESIVSSPLLANASMRETKDSEYAELHTDTSDCRVSMNTNQNLVSTSISLNSNAENEELINQSRCNQKINDSVRQCFKTLQQQAKIDSIPSITSHTTPSDQSIGEESNDQPKSLNVKILQEFGRKPDIPIFSDCFLRYNDLVEDHAKEIRKILSENEKTNLLLSEHTEKMSAEIEQLKIDEEKEKEKQVKLEKILKKLQQSLVQNFNREILLLAIESLKNKYDISRLSLENSDQLIDLLCKVRKNFDTTVNEEIKHKFYGKIRNMLSQMERFDY
ncbi:allergen [Sarcoptes scabiei]|nr:allergen [Sarcoptes scabiei]